MNPFSIQHTIRTTLSKDILLGKLAKAPRKSMPKRDFYLTYKFYQGRHIIDPIHNQMSRQLPMKIEMLVQSQPQGGADITLSFQVGMFIRMALMFVLVLYVGLFVLLTVFEALDTTWEMTSFKWAFLVFPPIWLFMLAVSLSGDVGYYLKAFKEMVREAEKNPE
ncbi:hypothetical protein BH09BAC1_BH09BAC1_11490 [soil metagenome]